MPSGVYVRKPMSDAHREAISKGKTGKKFSDEHRASIAAARLGATATEETKRKLREGSQQRAKDPEWRQRVSEGTVKRMHDPEIRERHLSGLMQYFATTPNGNNFPNRVPPSMLEYAAILRPIGYLMDTIRVSKGKGKGTGKTYTLDFALLENKINIEIDGSSHKYRQERDLERDEFLRSLGWKVIRIPV